MRVSKLIEELQEILERCGDLEVVEDEYGYPVVATEVMADKVYIQS